MPGGACIGVTRIKPFRRAKEHPLMPRSSGRLETLGAQAIARAFVWVGRAGPERWVDPRMFGDRSLGEAFACGWLGLIGRPTAGFTIDPMFTKTAGPLDGLTRMRLIAIDAAANQAAGRTLERAIADRARAVLGRCETTRNQGGTPREPKPIRHVTWMTLEQANGLASALEHLPGSADAVANLLLVRALFAHLAACSIRADFPRVRQPLTAHTLTRHRWTLSDRASAGRARVRAHRRWRGHSRHRRGASLRWPDRSRARA
jgi:hypothetical protein